MFDDRFSGFGTAGDNVYDSCGKSGFNSQFAETQGGERSLLGGLHDDGVATS
jgi:hypothetical protein